MTMPREDAEMVGNGLNMILRIGFALMMAAAVWAFVKYQDTRDFASAPALAAPAAETPEQPVDFYTVDGTRYRLFVDGGLLAPKPDEMLTVWYDPQDPNIAVVARQLFATQVLMAVAGFGLILLGLLQNRFRDT